jgi:predicted dehydrogenase
MRTLRHTNTALDTGTATIRFCSGDELLLAWSWGLPQGCSGTRVFEILGPNGTMTWPTAGDPSQQEFTITLAGGNKTATLVSPEDNLEAGYRKQIEEFVQVARGEKKPQVGGAEGREVLRVALAILESGRTQEVVHL